jgi:hypothetical protein
MERAADAAQALAKAAEQLRDKKHLNAACQTICDLAWPHSEITTVVIEAVTKLDLPSALAGALNELLCKRQRDWRAEAYADRVQCLVQAFLAVSKLRAAQPQQQQQQQQQQQATTPAGSMRGSSKAARGGSSRASRHRARQGPAVLLAAGIIP